MNHLLIKVWAQSQKPVSGAQGDLEATFANWGLGANITTKLVNTSGEVMYYISF